MEAEHAKQKQRARVSQSRVRTKVGGEMHPHKQKVSEPMKYTEDNHKGLRVPAGCDSQPYQCQFDWIKNTRGIRNHTSGQVCMGHGGITFGSVCLALFPCSASQLPRTKQLCSTVSFCNDVCTHVTMHRIPWNCEPKQTFLLGVCVRYCVPVTEKLTNA